MSQKKIRITTQIKRTYSLIEKLSFPRIALNAFKGMHAILHLLLNIEETFCMPIIFSDLSFNSPKNSATKSEFILFIEVDTQQNGDEAT